MMIRSMYALTIWWYWLLLLVVVVLLSLQSSSGSSDNPSSASEVKYPLQYSYVTNKHKQYQSIEYEQNQHPRFHKKRIAICLTGQVGRLLPRYVINNLILANPDFIFRIFIQLQVSSIHNTFPDPIFEPSEFTHFNDYALFKSLLHYFEQDNSRLIKMGLSLGHSIEYWQQYLQIDKLDRIRQFPPHIQYTILDMYYKQVNCSEDIIQYEKEHSFQFDYILLHREDIYYMGNMNLTHLITKYFPTEQRVNPINSNIHNHNFTGNLHFDSDKHDYCDFQFKNCLAWGGVNLRVQLYRRDPGLSLLSSRIEFYKFMAKNKLDVHHSEQFEGLQSERMGWKACGIDVNEFAILPARITRDYFSPPLSYKENQRDLILNDTTNTMQQMDHAKRNNHERLPDVSYRHGNSSLITGLCFLYVEVKFDRLKEFCYREEYKTFLHDNMCETHIKRMREHEKHHKPNNQ